MALRALTRRHSCAGTGQCLEATNEPTVGSVRRIEGVRRVVVQGHLGHLMATMAAKWVLHAALSRLFDVFMIEYARAKSREGRFVNLLRATPATPDELVTGLGHTLAVSEQGSGVTARCYPARNTPAERTIHLPE